MAAVFKIGCGIRFFPLLEQEGIVFRNMLHGRYGLCMRSLLLFSFIFCFSKSSSDSC